MKILIADDHALFRAGLRYVLAPLDQHMTLLEAADHAEAAALLAQHPDTDLALIDLFMPGRGDGVTAFDLLASNNLTIPSWCGPARKNGASCGACWMPALRPSGLAFRLKV